MARFASIIIIALLCGSHIYFPTLAVPIFVSPLPSDTGVLSEVAVPSSAPPLGQGLQLIGAMQGSAAAREPENAATTHIIDFEGKDWSFDDNSDSHTTEVELLKRGMDDSEDGTYSDVRGVSIPTHQREMNATVEVRIRDNLKNARLYETHASWMRRLVKALEQCIDLLKKMDSLHSTDSVMDILDTVPKLEPEARAIHAEFQQQVDRYKNAPGDPVESDLYDSAKRITTITQTLTDIVGPLPLYTYNGFDSRYLERLPSERKDFSKDVELLNRWILGCDMRAAYYKDNASLKLTDHHNPFKKDVSDPSKNF
ncbi:hypothetical protein F5880DRAFT_1016131 [Lentinula raphanica]|nr:hypothetical protein F5880DRAFT_1016131 [Lentinula raphanica]